MTEPRRQHLYLGTCIEDLEKLYAVRHDHKKTKAKLLINTAQKLFEEAEKYRESGDEECSFVHYMKYLYIISMLQKNHDYEKEKKYFTDLIGPQNPIKALDFADKLKESLTNRYAMQRAPSPVLRPLVLLAPEPAPPADPLDEILESTSTKISPQQLFALLSGGRRVMLLDVRSAREFAAARVKHDYCLSVPQEIIAPGQSANSLKTKLPEESRALWGERGDMQLIVLLDRDSDDMTPVRDNTPAGLFLLHTMLTKWDPHVKHSRPPRALRGGFANWVHLYPHAVQGAGAAAAAGGGHGCYTDDEMVENMLDGIDYPSSEVEEERPAPPAARAEPAVDRASKAAALLVYEERARQMQQILAKREQLASTTVSLEMEMMAREKEWENLNRQFELERRPDARAAYLLKEQEISSQLMQLANKQYDMEQENQSLREELKEYQRCEREEARLSDRHEFKELAVKRMQKKEAQIHRMEQRAAALVSSRAALSRSRNEAEARRRTRQQQEETGDTYMSSPDLTGGMNRSQSSPNIAKISSDEDEPAPTFDRSTKPIIKVAPSTDMRPRDFQPVWGSVGRGLTGLKNLGNTCYMNSIVQCLNNTAELATYFCDEQHLKHVNRTHGTRGAIAEELAAVVRALWSGQYRFIATKDLRNEVGKHQRAFRGCEQQDSHEFLTILMDWLHDDLQFSTGAPDKDSLPPSERAWHEFTKSRESRVLRLFYGQIRSTVQCLLCRSHSATYESFSNLSLELPTTASRCSLADCLKSYLQGERIPGWNCPNCKEKRDAVKKLDISKLPPILVIHFKRFYLDPKEYMCNSYRKKQTYVDFPLEDLDMSQFAIDATGNTSYSLYAVSNHYGSMEGGHYTAYCKSSCYSKWHKYDDHVVTEIPASDVKSSAAYILFYTSCRA